MLPPTVLARYENVVEKDRTFRSCGSAIVADAKTFALLDGFTKSVKWMPEQDLLAKFAYHGRAIQVIDLCTVYYRLQTSNTVHDVPKMIQGCYQLVAAAQGRIQPAGLGARLRSYPLIGGPAFLRGEESVSRWAVSGGLKAFGSSLAISDSGCRRPIERQPLWPSPD